MYYVGVDIGGTFTDCVLVDRQGNHRSAKVLSTKDDPVAGVLAGLSRLAETAGVNLPTLLERNARNLGGLVCLVCGLFFLVAWGDGDGVVRVLCGGVFVVVPGGER